MMSILNKVLPKPGIDVKKIINEFSKQERDDIYPPLSPILMQCLVEELELTGYLKIKDGKATVTSKGKKKIEAFKASLKTEERKALKM